MIDVIENLRMFYRKVKKFCFVVGFFWLNNNKKLLM
jgi:hypothetical protein